MACAGRRNLQKMIMYHVRPRYRDRGHLCGWIADRGEGTGRSYHGGIDRARTGVADALVVDRRCDRVSAPGDRNRDHPLASATGESQRSAPLCRRGGPGLHRFRQGPHASIPALVDTVHRLREWPNRVSCSLGFPGGQPRDDPDLSFHVHIPGNGSDLGGLALESSEWPASGTLGVVDVRTVGGR